jgi:hypothetical protein
MPNQRKKDMKLVGTFVDKKVKKAFDDKAKSKGLTSADLMRELIDKLLREETNNPQR